jgi:hypothetical protein
MSQEPTGIWQRLIAEEKNKQPIKFKTTLEPLTFINNNVPERKFVERESNLTDEETELLARTLFNYWN